MKYINKVNWDKVQELKKQNKNKKNMKATDLTPLQRIEILEDVLRKLESGDRVGCLCYKIENSAYALLRVCGKAKNIIPIFRFRKAKKVTDIKEYEGEGAFWWDYENYDFENRIKFVKWMINKEKLTNNI